MEKKEVKRLDVKATAKKSAQKAQGLMTEFKDFLKEYKVLGIAAGLVIGTAVSTLTQALVVGIITPLIQLILPAQESWKSMTFTVNGTDFRVGMVVAATINFLVVALLFFIFVKVFLKKDKVTKDALA